MLEGSRTYIVAALIILCSVLKAWGWMDEATYQTVLGILIGAGFVTVRQGIATDTGKAAEAVKSLKAEIKKADCQ